MLSLDRSVTYSSRWGYYNAHMKNRKFAKFYQVNLDRIYRYVFFRTGQNRDVAEDLVSEIFMKAMKAFDRYDPKKSKSAWIYQIAHNHLANYYRDKKQTVDIDDVAFCLEGEDGKKVMEMREEEMVLYNSLDQLNKNERQLVTMKYLEGYAYKDMAEIMGKSAASLKVATHRAMQKLRTMLTKKI